MPIPPQSQSPTSLGTKTIGQLLVQYSLPAIIASLATSLYIQSIGKPKLSIFLSLTRQLIFLLPLLWILPKHFGVDGVWASMAGSDFLAFVLALLTVLITSPKIKRALTQK